MSIKPLPASVVAQIKSSVLITSLNCVVLGLIKNSLDAGAAKIHVTIDHAHGNCVVEDDGQGIPPFAFQESGGLGKLHYTSHFPPNANTYGRDGAFVASLAALALVSIASHHRDYLSHNAVTFHNSNVVARHVPALPAERFLVFPSGTRVTVRDLFGSMPVRVKQRARDADRLGTARQFDQLMSRIVALLVAWPGSVIVSVRDMRSRKAVSLRASLSPNASRSSDRMATSLLARVPSMFAQASLGSIEDAASWVTVGASASGLVIDGSICLVPAATRRAQCISLGIRPLENDGSANVLFDEVNKAFANSKFGAEDTVSHDLRNDQSGQALSSRDRWKRGPDRWPMFCFLVSLETTDTSAVWDVNDILNTRQASLEVISSLLRMIAYQFLEKHQFQPRQINAVDKLRSASGWDTIPSSQRSRSIAGRSQTRSSDSKKSRSSRSTSLAPPQDVQQRREDSPFTQWSRVKSSGPIKPILKAPCTEGEPATNESKSKTRSTSPVRTWIDKEGKLLRRPFGGDNDVGTIDTNKAVASLPAGDETNTLDWQDPVTKVKSLIDKRTGSTLSDPYETRRKRITLRPAIHDSSPAEEKPEREAWLNGILDTWKNPVFEPTERDIDRVTDCACCLGSVACSHSSNSKVAFGGLGGTSSIALGGKLSQKGLQKAEVIAQVDSKFILVKMPQEDIGSTHQELRGSRLVLIDQHAADERCRVEELLGSYFKREGDRWKARTDPLQKPLRFEVPGREGELLVRYRDHFEHWGIRYDVSVTDGSQRSGRPRFIVQILSLPPSISERCRLEPRLAIDLVRAEVWKAHDQPGMSMGPRSLLTDSVKVDGDWVSRMHGCPQGILDLVNSRSCRSAIMFNDPLSHQECTKLLSRLVQCAFPFQCAHGRPSMVPLLDLGREADAGWQGDCLEGDFGARLQRWKTARKAMDIS